MLVIHGDMLTECLWFQGVSWSNATKVMPQCNWVVNGSIHCDWGAQQLAYDAKSGTVFLAVGNSTGGLGKGHGCDDGDGNEENGVSII